MNKEFKEIIDRIDELTGTWDIMTLPSRVLLPALMHLERRVEANERHIGKIIENQESLLNILGKLHIVPKREDL